MPGGRRATRQAPRRRGRWVALGVVGALLAGAAAASPYLWHTWQLRQQSESYRTGHAAYLTGDCGRAVPALKAAARPGLDGRKAAQARYEQSACEVFSRSAAIAAKGPATAVSAYSLLITSGTTPELSRVAVTRAQQALTTAKPEQLATEELCAGTETLRRQGVLTEDLEPRVMPEVLLVCGSHAAGNHLRPTAITAYTAAARYPATHDRAVAGLADVLVGLATYEESARGQQVDDRGPAGGSGSGATLVLRNNDPWPVAVALAGPTRTLVELPGCDGCRADDVRCSGTSPDPAAVVTVKVEAGSYPIAWQALPPGGDPFTVRATWTLRRGHRAQACLDATDLPAGRFRNTRWPSV
jgi:hypothetical protein